MNVISHSVVMHAAVLTLFATTGALAEESSVPLSRLGAFNRAISYVWEFEPAELSLDTHPWGANNDEAWIYARVFTTSGKQYVVMRTVAGLRTEGVTLTTDGEADPRVPRVAGAAARAVEPDAGLVFAGDGFDVQLSPAAVSWIDQNGEISLKGAGSALGRVGTSAFIPYYKDGATAINMYTGQYQPVTGSIFGEPVEGMFVIDHFVGTEKFSGSNLMTNFAVWFKFANVFEDGSVEMGEVFTFAKDKGIRGAVVTDGTREIASSTDPRVQFVFDEQDRLLGETWTIGDQQWEMLPDDTGAAALGKTGILRNWGGVRRVGDDRKIVNQFAITEYRMALLDSSERVVRRK